MRWVVRARAVLLAVAIITIAGTAFADRVDRLAQKLASAEDFRVRTQAALALGASKSSRAVEPLCGGLQDSNTTVRAASAAGLGKLKKGGVDCLERRLDSESSDSVKSVIKKAIARIKGASGPAITDSTEYYIAIGDLKDKTNGDADALGKLIRKGMLKRMGKLDGYAVAPAGESSSDAKKLLSKYPKARGFYLVPTLKRRKFVAGKLKVKLQVAIFTYPNKALKGSYSKSLTMPDVSEGDSSAERELLEMLGDRAMKQFSSTVASIP